MQLVEGNHKLMREKQQGDRDGSKKRKRESEYFYKPVNMCEREIKRENKRQRAGITLGA